MSAMNAAVVRAPSATLFDVPIHAVTMEQALVIVHDAITRRERLQIGVVNAAKIVNMRRDPALGEDVLTSGLILADGMSIVWASRLVGRPLPERVTGIDLMLRMLAGGSGRRYRIYCLGATDEVSRRVADRIISDYPGVELAGRHHGYFTDADESRVADDIARARADILLVAMTSPKKERFLARWSAHIGVPVCHGVGGSFDVFSGEVERAPESWQRLGLEWLYRLKQEPRRLWRRYLVTNSLFSGLVLREFWRIRFGRAPAGDSRK